jgi:hypothetical protein
MERDGESGEKRLSKRESGEAAERQALTESGPAIELKTQANIEASLSYLRNSINVE